MTSGITVAVLARGERGLSTMRKLPASSLFVLLLLSNAHKRRLDFKLSMLVVESQA